jgi:hypothetical protein
MVDIFDAHPVDRDLARIGVALHVRHGLGMRLLRGDGDVHMNFLLVRSSANMVPKPHISRILDHSAGFG